MRPLLIGHRGYSAKYPENTLLSFMAALYYGADGVELDVWAAGDGRAVVIHDEDTERVAGVRVPVKGSSVSELRRAYLGMGQVVPTLDEVFRALPAGKLLLVEAKDVDVVGEVVGLAVEHGRLDETVLISFIPEALVRARELSSRLMIGLNVDSLEKAEWGLRKSGEIGLHSINPPVEGLEALGGKALDYLEKARRAGLKVYVWTVNDPQQALKWAPHCDAIITDEVEKVGRALRGVGE
ncbi:glycerophosphodiester phosphodiesterase family protein [Thermogladius sp.]|uniref:glycerophosphodiester phosphodiesterase family protein n=1 Tax=Thermogladius sp. TaxID=2023064 RepID=UPI003D0EEA70